VNAWHTPDTQTLIALGLGLVAALHVLRRWWPQWAGLLASRRAAASNASHMACGQAGATPVSAPACSAGCGQCGSASSTATKDHRVHIVRPAKP
jgi:hypothetical protein